MSSKKDLMGTIDCVQLFENSAKCQNRGLKELYVHRLSRLTIIYQILTFQVFSYSVEKVVTKLAFIAICMHFPRRCFPEHFSEK